MHLNNIFLGPLFLIIVFGIAALLKKRLCKTDLERRYYFRALFLKLFGVTAFTMVYYFYYGGGDSIGYFEWASRFSSYIFRDFPGAMDYLFTNDRIAFNTFKYNNLVNKYGYILKFGTRETAFIKITSVINLFALNSYLSTSYVFAFFSFICNWRLYRTFVVKYPDISKQLLLACVFVPSVCFWGTGILKDTLTFSFLCLLVVYVDKVFMQRKSLLVGIPIIALSSYFILTIKGYVLLAFLPAALFWVANEYKNKIKSTALKVIITPLFALTLGGVLFGLIGTINASLGKYSVESLENTVKDFQRWHNQAAEDGSNYNLNMSGTSPTDLLKAMPAAVNVTYFRPYIWESGSIIVFVSAIESALFFGFFLWVFFVKGKVINFIRVSFSDSNVIALLIFTLFFGFAVGITSYNFGALSRYKIPSMPFFAMYLVICAYKLGAFKKKLESTSDKVV